MYSSKERTKRAKSSNLGVVKQLSFVSVRASTYLNVILQTGFGREIDLFKGQNHINRLK